MPAQSGIKSTPPLKIFKEKRKNLLGRRPRIVKKESVRRLGFEVKAYDSTRPVKAPVKGHVCPFFDEADGHMGISIKLIHANPINAVHLSDFGRLNLAEDIYAVVYQLKRLVYSSTQVVYIVVDISLLITERLY